MEGEFRRSGRTIDRPTKTVNSSEAARTSKTATPITTAVMIALLCSAVARATAELTRLCSTKCTLVMVFVMSPCQSEGTMPMPTRD